MQFYKEENFKEMHGLRVPEDWEVVRIGDFIKYIKGKKPAVMVDEELEGYYPYLSTEYLRDGIASKFVKITNKEIIVNENDILLLWDGSNAGEIFLGKKGILSSTMVKLEQKNKIMDDLYLFYSLKLKESFLKSQTKGTGIPHVDKKIFENIKIPLPPLEEQKQIAKILSDFDNLIGTINKQIEVLNKAKKGMMKKLFTKGVFEHKSFKKSEIGEIPEDWEVVKLKEVVDIQSGKYFKYSEFCENGVKCLKIDNVGFGKIFWETVSFLPEDYLNKYPQLVLKSGDIVLALNRPIIGGKIKIGILKDIDEPAILYQRVGRFIFKSEKIDKQFLFYLLMSEYFKKELSKLLIGTDQPYIRTPVLLNIKIPLPHLEEQKAMAERLKSIDNLIEIKRKEKEQIEKAKKKIMNLLLTGKIRVKNLNF
ncbi:TPA: restriction endonuclease subunit S [Methanocaldococcus jannaschii]|nr:restriction endonuclease subunit S [Methanocaldococcus jannaschii]HII59975.1 restriction endonuclease subunit S [Methanocaldococcus jannaschii]